jgi:hypothetical protein
VRHRLRQASARERGALVEVRRDDHERAAVRQRGDEREAEEIRVAEVFDVHVGLAVRPAEAHGSRARCSRRTQHPPPRRSARHSRGLRCGCRRSAAARPGRRWTTTLALSYVDSAVVYAYGPPSSGRRSEPEGRGAARRQDRPGRRGQRDRRRAGYRWGGDRWGRRGRPGYGRRAHDEAGHLRHVRLCEADLLSADLDAGAAVLDDQDPVVRPVRQLLREPAALPTDALQRARADTAGHEPDPALVSGRRYLHRA